MVHRKTCTRTTLNELASLEGVDKPAKAGNKGQIGDLDVRCTA
eukprot:COSAG06_NODE_5246_length_3612_cov_5.264446_4_plen_43_part_00